jgi:hypothetical protein
MNRSGWLIFSSVVLIIAGVMRALDAAWAFRYNGALPNNLEGALLGHSLQAYGWVWLVMGIILVAAGTLVRGPTSRVSAEISRWTGIVAASLGAISAVILMPYFPVWSFTYVAIAVMVIYGLSAHFDEKTTAS